ncbi:MAG: PepSY-like domain-containing protein [Prevotellaceae bacterium]|jgi:hypothetical protein|nr:PepSY-like domain-containing protein [Prevotellaceae bacterium]
MKKISLLLVCFAITTAAFADKDKAISVDKLPAGAKQFIETHFAASKVALAKVETDFMDKTYKVVFVDGSKVEFNRKGEWKDVDCKYSQVPSAIIPQKIREYVIANHPDAKIIEIDRDRRDYEIKLHNGLELKFDLKFNLIDIDS